MALGEILKNARLQKGLTTSQVAESTHLMVQVVECLEKEDFRRIAAAIYGRGFVKLYAQFLGLDPDPLVRDFVELYDGAKPPAVKTRAVHSEETAAPASAAPKAADTPPAQRPVVAIRHPAAAPKEAAIPPVQKPVPAAGPVIKTRLVSRTIAASPAAAEPAKVVPVVSRKPIVVTVEEKPAQARPDQPAKTQAAPAEPDLFHPLADRQAKDTARPAQAAALDRVAQAAAIAAEKAKAEADAAKSREVRKAKIQTFITHVSQVKAGFGRFWGFVSEHSRQTLLTGGAIAALVLLALGVRTLFRLTEHQDNTAPGSAGAVCDPPPAMYAD
jgi:cytoskeleton protein RodZ